MEDDKKITILQVIPALETGGAERTAVDIGAAVVNENWRSIVASEGGRLLDDLLANGSEHVHLPLDTKSPWRIWRNAAALETLIRREGVSLIHARSRAPAWSAFLAARRTGIPFVTTYHGAYGQTHTLKALYNSVMARADRVIANSGWTAELIAERHPWAEERITAIGRGTDFNAFDPAGIAEERIARQRAAWGASQEDFVFLHLARLTGWKGQATVIEAAARIAGSHERTRFVLAGDAQGRSAYLAGLEAAVERHDLAGRVVMPGHCDDPAAALAACDVAVVASIEAEAFGRAAVEAGALQKPVIVSDIGAVGETVVSPKDDPETFTGWKVPPGDAAALADAMRHALSLSPAERDAIGMRARSRGERLFSVEQMCRQTLEVYRDLLD